MRVKPDGRRSLKGGGEDHTRQWLVYEQEGGLIGSISIGLGDTLLDAGPDYAPVRTVGELDVEEVRLFELERE